MTLDMDFINLSYFYGRTDNRFFDLNQCVRDFFRVRRKFLSLENKVYYYWINLEFLFVILL